MALTNLKIYLDPPVIRGTQLPFDGLIEYSKNETGREIVTLWVIPTPNDANVVGEQITVRMMKARRDRNEEVVQARRTYTFTGPVPVEGVSFSWDLRRVVYSTEDPFNVIRRGNYFFEVEHSGGPTYPSGTNATSEDWRATVMTTDRLEKEWLRGATRRSNDDRAVRFQPKELNGVWVIEVSRNHPLDIFELELVPDKHSTVNWSLSWNRGEIVPIDMRIPEGIHQQLILPDRWGTHYIVVQVDPRKLPTTHTTERLMIDRELIDRDSLRRWIDEEADWLEQTFLYTPIEPALCVSDFTLRNLTPSTGLIPPPAPLPENFDYDLFGPPIMYKPPTAGHWIGLDVPWGKPIKWEYLVGALEHTRIVDIRPDWIQPASGRRIHLLPYNQSLAYSFIGLMYVHAIRGPVELPSFWRYRYWAGLKDEKTPMDIIQVIGLRAGAQALAVLGQMFRGGFSSQSVSRDGVSESVSYTASAMYGIYSATIEAFNKRLEKLEPQVKRKYFGIYIAAL